ncbi:MAG: hypothetical protein ACKOJF_09335, partial [Planctomycetaceae bacterium]
TAPPQPPTDVLLVVGLEASPEVLQERLAHLGADVHRVQVLRIMQEETKNNVSLSRNFALDRDLGLLAHHLEFHPAVQLVVLDSFDRLAGSRFSPTLIRQLLTRLQVLAAASGVAILVTKSYAHVPRPGRHLRALGCSVFADCLRSIWAIEQPALAGAPDDEESPPTHRLVPLKLNDCERSTTLDFTLRNHRVEWLGPPRDCSTRHHGYDPAQARRREERNAQEEARDFLQALLAEGPLPSFQVRQSAERAGLGWRTVQRAKQHLEITSSMHRAGREQSWTWWLPGTPTTPAPGPTSHTDPAASHAAASHAAASHAAASHAVTARVDRRQPIETSDWSTPQTSLELGVEESLAGNWQPPPAIRARAGLSETVPTSLTPLAPGAVHSALPHSLADQACGAGAVQWPGEPVEVDPPRRARLVITPLSELVSATHAMSPAHSPMTAAGSADNLRATPGTSPSENPPVNTPANGKSATGGDAGDHPARAEATQWVELNSPSGTISAAGEGAMPEQRDGTATAGRTGEVTKGEPALGAPPLRRLSKEEKRRRHLNRKQLARRR